MPVIDIGGTHVSAALVDSRSGRVIAGSLSSLPLNSHAPADEIVGVVLRCAQPVNVCRAATWGVAIPGPFDYARGIGGFEGVAKFDALSGLDLRTRLLEGLGSGAGAILFINDADAFLLGEWASGAAAAHARAVGITLGTGVGSAFLAEGSIVDSGPLVPPEGRVDLLTIGGRPIEEVVSRRALIAAYGAASEGSDGGELDVRELAELARRGSTPAAGVLDRSLESLGLVLAPWLSRFEATILVVGGSIARSWDVIERPLRRGIERGTPGLTSRMELSSARRPDEAPLIGAAAHVTAHGQASR